MLDNERKMMTPKILSLSEMPTRPSRLMKVDRDHEQADRKILDMIDPCRATSLQRNLLANRRNSYSLDERKRIHGTAEQVETAMYCSCH